MATRKQAANKKKKVQELTFVWEGFDKNKKGKYVRGEMIATNKASIETMLRKQGIDKVKVKKKKENTSPIKNADIMIFTRQLATMMRAGVPLIQAFEIVAKGNNNKNVTTLLMDIKYDVETGTSLSGAFKKYPLYFDALFCNLIAAGEAAGILDTLLDRLATYKEKTEAIKKKIKSALMYPISILVVAFIVTAIIMIFVVPAFKEMFSSFGSDLPAPTLVVMHISDFFVEWWWAIFGIVGGSVWWFLKTWKTSVPMQKKMDKILLNAPLIGDLVMKASVARWARTLSTMFAAGVPLVEAFNSVAGAAGNAVYYDATKDIQDEVATGTSLTAAMTNAMIFPSMVIQMVAIGEESGALDGMLSKVADFYEEEVDNAVEGLSSMMEPLIMAVLGVIIGGLVIAMYLPIFKMGQAV